MRLNAYKAAGGDTSPKRLQVVRLLTKPAKVYDEAADARQQIAAALVSAKTNNHRVLIQWGGNWCDWCLRLHELMASDKPIMAMLASNYEVVHIDTGRPVGKNIDLAKSYGIDTSNLALPYLTILDADGKVLANHDTGSLEIGGIDAGHDPKKLLALLQAYALNPVAPLATGASDANTPAAETNPQVQQGHATGQTFDLSFADAISGKSIDVQKVLKGKIVVIDFWATWCGPCVAEMPKNKEIYAKYKDRGVEFIGVSLDQPESQGGWAAEGFRSENEISWPQYYDGKYVYSDFSRGWGSIRSPGCSSSMPTESCIRPRPAAILKQ